MPEIAKVVGISSAQSLHHFLAESPWSVEEFRTYALTNMLKCAYTKNGYSDRFTGGTTQCVIYLIVLFKYIVIGELINI